MMFGLKKVRWPPGRCVAADALDLQPVHAEEEVSGVVRGDELSRAARAILRLLCCLPAPPTRWRRSRLPRRCGTKHMSPPMPAAVGSYAAGDAGGQFSCRAGLTCMAVARRLLLTRAAAASGHFAQTAVQVRATRCVLWPHSAPQPGSRRLTVPMPPAPAWAPWVCAAHCRPRFLPYGVACRASGPRPAGPVRVSPGRALGPGLARRLPCTVLRPSRPMPVGLVPRPCWPFRADHEARITLPIRRGRTLLALALGLDSPSFQPVIHCIAPRRPSDPRAGLGP